VGKVPETGEEEVEETADEDRRPGNGGAGAS